jgi:hypothetical protein
VDHAHDGDRSILRQVCGWIEADPAIYFGGNGCRDAEDFLDPPCGSVEYLVVADDKPAAFLTLIPLATVRGVYQAGLITNPDASLRKICRLLQGFIGEVFERLAQAVFVELPDSPKFSPTRKLAGFFGFKQVSATTFMITRGEYGLAQKREKDDIPVDLAKGAASPNKSDLIAVNNAQRATIIVQTSAPLTAPTGGTVEKISGYIK